MIALDRMAGVYDDLTIQNLDWEDIQRTRRRPSNDFPSGIEERAMARAVKLMFVFSPWNSTTKMGAAVPQSQHPAVFKAGKEETAF